MRQKIFIGVAWPYANGELHVGHLAGYLLPADIFARFNRFIGNDVLMVSGSDCFGTPITIEADKKDSTPEKISSHYHEKNVELFQKVGISYDLYTKTNTPNHKKITQEFFLNALKKGFIFKDTMKQYYSEKENKFLPDRYVEGECPFCAFKSARSDQCDNCSAVIDQGELKNPLSKLSGSAVSLKNSEHYFLNWPKLEPFLKKYFAEKRKEWRDWVAEETDGWLKKGLKPRAITRDLDWGIEIPDAEIPENLKLQNSEHKRIYVWFDAVIGYLSASIEWSKKQASAESYKEWWYLNSAKHYYFMGKDNLVFHALFWPGQLYLYDEKIHLPDVPVINQFLKLDNQKFSKSRNVIVDSRYICDIYGADPVRFYLSTIMPENHDTNFSWSDFVSVTNNILIATIANFIMRTLTLASRADLKHGTYEKKEARQISELINYAEEAARCGSFKKYTETVIQIAGLGNKYISDREPWFLQENDKKFSEVIGTAMIFVLALEVVLKPLLPETAAKISHMTGISFKLWPNNDELTSSLKNVKTSSLKPLFAKIDEKIVEIEQNKIG